MTAKKTAPIEIDDEGQYRVDLTQPIKVGRSTTRPGSDVVLKGKVIKGLDDGIAINIRAVAD